ncbi:MAG: TPM domain-containing protein [Spirochaetales bacterium]|nr:TPM domain-containing protein [Candidatus Physcosoma equi]
MKKLVLFLMVLVLIVTGLFARSFVDDKLGLLDENNVLNIETYYSQIESYTGTVIAVHTFRGDDESIKNDAYIDQYVEDRYASDEDYALLFAYTEGTEDIYYCTYISGTLFDAYGEDAPNFFFQIMDDMEDDITYEDTFAIFGDSIVALYEYMGQKASGLIVDEAGLLSNEEYNTLSENLAYYSGEVGYPIMVATVTHVKGKNTVDDSDLLLEDYVGINGDGVMLYVNMGSREWNITTSGAAIRELNDRSLSRLENVFLSDLSAGNYLEAFDSFGAAARTYALNARRGLADSGYNETDDESFDVTFFIFLGLILGVTIAAITVSVMKRKLKSAVLVNDADQFVKDGSFVLTTQQDIFLYRHVSRVKIERNTSSGGSSVHHSSSGGSHGGRSGRF